MLGSALGCHTAAPLTEARRDAIVENYFDILVHVWGLSFHFEGMYSRQKNILIEHNAS